MASPMTPERFQDRFEAFRGEPQQVSGVWILDPRGSEEAGMAGPQLAAPAPHPWLLPLYRQGTVYVGGVPVKK
jgi:hypothetical protein